MKKILNFLSRPVCGRCKQVAPLAKAFAEENGYEFVERNVDSEINGFDRSVLISTQQRALPIVYFQGDVAWAAVNPNTFNFEDAHEHFLELENSSEEE